MFWTFYAVSLVYCFIQVSKRWKKDAMPGGLGINPGLDTLAILFYYKSGMVELLHHIQYN